jgi:hypothetical protein
MVKLTRFLILFFINLTAIGQSPLSQAIKKVIPSVFLIKTFDSQHKELAIGTGFFIDSLGTGITNYHVLEGASAATITLQDGAEFPIQYINGQDEQRDLIRFRVKSSSSAKGLAYLKLSNKKPQLGEDVFTIGNPEGLSFSVSDGIVSSVREDEIGTVIQTTAPISPGSSGSPLLNLKGEVIGVISFYYQDGQNLNFAIGVNHLKEMTSTNPAYKFPVQRESSSTLAEDDNFFKKHEWNLTQYNVRKRETAKLISDDPDVATNQPQLQYSASLAGKPVKIEYNFDGGKLSSIYYRGNFGLTDGGSEKTLVQLNESINYFLVVFPELTERLGEPCGCEEYGYNEWNNQLRYDIEFATKEKCIALNELNRYKIGSQAKKSFERGRQICLGAGKVYNAEIDDYVYRVYWETEDSEYFMSLKYFPETSFLRKNSSDDNPNAESNWNLFIKPKDIISKCNSND